MPRGKHEYARQQKLDVEYADVMNIIQEHYKGEPESAWMLERPVDLKATGAYELVIIVCSPTLPASNSLAFRVG